MKKIFTLVLLLPLLTVSGQNYRLFNAGSVKVFTTFPDAGPTFSLAFDSVSQTGGDSVYYPYRSVADEYIPADSCTFWGSPDCRPQTKPIWAGAEVVNFSSNHYRLITNAGDTLLFDFGLLPGGNATFYEDEVQRFKLFALNRDTISILGQVDSVMPFRIAHTDIQGNTIESALNNQLVILGRDFGLIRFFLVDSFPQVLQPIVLLGNSAPEAGLIKLNYEMVFDHQSGDEIQYHDFFNRPYGPPGDNYDRFIKHTFLSRTDNAETVSYTVARFTFYLDSLTGIYDTIQLTYQKNEILAHAPYEKPDTLMFLEKRSLYLDNYFGLPLWSYSVKPENLVYCGMENCWGNYDTQGPPVEGELITVAGLGVYLNSGYQFGAPPYGYSYAKMIVYFKKDGISYGDEVVVGIDGHPLTGEFEIYPNPAGDRLFVKTNHSEMGTIQIINLNGQPLLETALENQVTGIDISNLQPGVYMVRIIGDKYLITRKLIKQ